VRFDDERRPRDPGKYINSDAFTSLHISTAMDRVKKALFGKKRSLTQRITRAIRKRFPKKDDPSIIEGFDNPNYNPYHRGKGRKRRKRKRVAKKRIARKRLTRKRNK
jgi:hypothetical protein